MHVSQNTRFLASLQEIIRNRKKQFISLFPNLQYQICNSRCLQGTCLCLTSPILQNVRALPSPTPTSHPLLQPGSHHFSLSESWIFPSTDLNSVIQQLGKYLGTIFRSPLLRTYFKIQSRLIQEFNVLYMCVGVLVWV